MITWNYKSTLGGLAFLSLAGCDAELSGAGPNLALPQAQMVSGTVALVPPPGYCIDRRSLKDRFALMARCDKLGAPSASATAPLGLITVSLSAGESLPNPTDIARALSLEDVADQSTTADSVVFRASGEPPVAGMGRRHWRGAALVAGQVMGVAVYGPPGGRASGAGGRSLVTDLIAGTNAIPAP